jgi:peptide/nickel transport system substrate-binding protein
VERRSLMLLSLVAAFVLAFAVGCGGDDDEEAGDTGTGGETTAAAEGGTLVFGTSSDPVVLDGALVSDGESIRVIGQIFETLVFLKPGTTEPEPGLATEWEADEAGTTWTFQIREGVKFHDDTDLDAEAVCFNFDRWYNFKGSFQNPSASYYWQVVFGGFATQDNPDAPEESLYESCEATDTHTAVIRLTKPSATFIPALSQQAFSIASPQALREFGADEGNVDEEGVFHPTGTFGTEHPIGTGPFRFESWQRNDRLTISRFDGYWGETAKLDEVIFRPIPDNAARLQALQTGEIQGYDLVEPQDIETVEGDESLQILRRPAFNVAYVGINQAIPPMDRIEVRQAIAHGLNREEVVGSFYPEGAEVATQFMPPSVEGHADDVETYDFDPDRSKELLQQAGLTPPVEITFWYPSDVSRPYMPDPKRNFEAFKASLEQSGFRVTSRTAPWSPDYLGAVDEGNAQVYLLGWTGDYGDADNFIGTFFQESQKAWGTDKKPNQEVMNLLDQGEEETDQEARVGIYEDANRAIMEWLPGVPYAHTEPALAFAANVQGYEPSPTSNESFATVSIEE